MDAEGAKERLFLTPFFKRSGKRTGAKRQSVFFFLLTDAFRLLVAFIGF
ncbi:hypothetical protein AC062_1721 [Pasteurellaceae bacterium NI1060]|nr:hypothetical protein AC062_1721 [Pasteurellaceae bacterium NI1060]